MASGGCVGIQETCKHLGINSVQLQVMKNSDHFLKWNLAAPRLFLN